MKIISIAGLALLAFSGAHAQEARQADIVQLSSSGPLQLSNLTTNSNQVGLYEKFEITFDLQGDWDNPFDPEQIKVDASFRDPDGEHITIPGFFYQAYYQNANGRLKKVGDPVWKVRFAPAKEGEYSFEVIANNKWRELKSDMQSFRSVSYNGSHGFIRISKTNPLYFEFDDGTPFFGVAMDMNQGDNNGTYQRFANSGGNLNRLFPGGKFHLEGISPQNPRPDRGLGKMNQESAWNLDWMMELGEKLGIYQMLTLTNQTSFNNRWAQHAYNRANGGVLDEPGDYWTNEEAMRFFERRLRYLVARWSYSTSLFSWDLWNEYSAMRASAGENGINWHRRMARYIAALDAFEHPIHTNDGSLNGRDDVHSMPEIEVVSTNTYGVKDVAHLAEVWTKYHTRTFGKPYLLTEVGPGHSIGNYGEMDPERRMVHDNLWSPLMSGSAGTGMAWEGSWLNHPLFYTYTRAVAKFVEGIPFSKRTWSPVSVASFRFSDSQTPAYYGDALFEGWPGNFRIPNNQAIEQGVFEIDSDGGVHPQESLSAVLVSKSEQNTSWLVAPYGITSSATFDVTYPVDGRFVIFVSELRSTEPAPQLTASLDGKRALQVDLVPLNIDNYRPRMYNKHYSVDVPEGHHTIRVENSGGGSFVTAFELQNFVPRTGPDLQVRGLQTEDHILLWLKNQKFTFAHQMTGIGMQSQPEGVLELQNVPDGRWLVEWMNTIDGTDVETRIVESRNQELVLKTPPVKESIAGRLRRM